jgi:DNA-binding FadR family transcriptional regulator
MQQFGVSRTVVREAIKELETKGLIRVRQGSGMTVLAPEGWDMLDPDILAAELAGHGAEQLLHELTRVRIALECEMAEQAAWRVTDAQLVRMEAHLAYMRELGDSPDRYLDADLEFHDMILAAAGNRIAEVIMRSMHEPLRRSRRLTNQIPGGIASAQEFHEAIFEQLRQRNAAGARAAMSEHLAWSWQAYRSMIAGGPVAYSRGKAQLPTT